MNRLTCRLPLKKRIEQVGGLADARRRNLVAPAAYP